jgi:hypothetical protein
MRARPEDVPLTIGSRLRLLTCDISRELPSPSVPVFQTADRVMAVE